MDISTAVAASMSDEPKSHDMALGYSLGYSFSFIDLDS